MLFTNTLFLYTKYIANFCYDFNYSFYTEQFKFEKKTL